MSAKSTVTVDTGDSTGAKEQVQRKSQPKLKGMELQNAVQKQAEFYLSRDNLQNDAYLVSQMDANLFVPLHTIANFPKIANLTKEIKVVLKAIQASTLVSLNEDESLVKPNFTLERNTIILRDIASDIPKEDVKQLFADVGAQPVDVRSDVNDVWFIRLKNEDEAKTALLGLLGKEFNGKPVRGGLKTESLLRSVTPKGAPPKNLLSDGNPSGQVSLGNGQAAAVNNIYQPQAMGMPPMFAPMQSNGMPPMYGYMNGIPGPPQPYMNGGVPYINGGGYLNAHQMYRPHVPYQSKGGKGGQNAQRSRGGMGGSNYNGGMAQSGFQNNSRFGQNGAGRGVAGGHAGSRAGRGSSANSGTRANARFGQNSGGPFFGNGGAAAQSGGNFSGGKGVSGDSIGAKETGKRGAKSRKSGNKEGKKYQDGAGKGGSNAKEAGKPRRNSKNTKINFSSASDFPSLSNGTSPAVPGIPVWGSGDASATRAPPSQDGSIREAFSRLKTNAGTDSTGLAADVSSVPQNAKLNDKPDTMIAAIVTDEDQSSANKPPMENKSVGDDKKSSWAATVAKTANVPVKPVAAKINASQKNGKDGSKKTRSKESGPKVKAKVGGVSAKVTPSSPDISQTPVVANEGDSSDSGLPGLQPQPTSVAVPPPRRGWERPELAAERARAKVEKERREMEQGRSGGSTEDSGSNQAEQVDDEVGERTYSKTPLLRAAPSAVEERPTSTERSWGRGRDNSGRPTFADMLKKTPAPTRSVVSGAGAPLTGNTDAQSIGPSSDERDNVGSQVSLKSSRANAFAEATGAQRAQRENFGTSVNGEGRRVESSVAWGDRG
jgi:hypothetical protein